jgi:response regulator RpfG family c-di-GMP phosphodiesterase
MKEKILFVDDDRNLLASWERTLKRQFSLDTAEGGEAGLARFAGGGAYAVVVADRQMPGMDGIEFLSKVRQRNPDTVRIMLTGNADLESTIRVVNDGNIFRFLTKPCPLDLLSVALVDALEQYRLVTAEKELLSKTLGGSIKLLTDILSMVEPLAFGRAQALREVVTHLTEKLGLSNSWEVHLALMLAPIGYVTIPPATLVKSRAGEPLSQAEEQMLNSTPESAARLLANIPRLDGVARIVRYQHKDFNGSGFPADSVCGDAIPLGSRLLRILLDMIQLHGKGRTQLQALDEMQTSEGCYDPALLSAVRVSLTGARSAPVTAPRTTVSVAPKDLTPGMVLRSNLKSKDGTLILSAGHQITGLTLEKIRNFDLVAGIAEPILVESPEGPAAWQ